MEKRVTTIIQTNSLKHKNTLFLGNPANFCTDSLKFAY